jgi:hypothetical protein
MQKIRGFGSDGSATVKSRRNRWLQPLCHRFQPVLFFDYLDS